MFGWIGRWFAGSDLPLDKAIDYQYSRMRADIEREVKEARENKTVWQIREVIAMEIPDVNWSEGWEPFAAGQGTIFIRRQIRVPRHPATDTQS